MLLTVRRAPRLRAPAAVFLAIAILGAGAQRAEAASLPPDVFVDCTKALLKNTSKVLKKRLDALRVCANELMHCALTDELTPLTLGSCPSGPIATCNEALDAQTRFEDIARTKLGKACLSLASYDFATSVGIGYRRLFGECGVLNTEAEAYDCLISRIRCRATDIVERVYPRLYEQLEETGLLAARPDDLECLDVRVDSPGTTGEADKLLACQAGLGKSILKPFIKVPKDLSSCVGDTLGCQLREDRRRTLEVQPPACFVDAEPSCDRSEKKITSLLSSEFAAKVAGSCEDVTAADMKTALGFGLDCPGAATAADIVACERDLASVPVLRLVDEAAPRTCGLADASGHGVFALGDFCTPVCGNNQIEDGETCDDGNGNDNDTCNNECETGPTAHESVLLPSSAQPAHTPDGTLLTAVDPGSTVETQFGTTMPDLNNVSYVRYYAPGAGDPDAVLVLVPGFAGGAHSLKIVAETMVAKAAAAGNVVLEVWTFDRRTDQLEDDEGGELAESEDNPELAINWYFGGELGMTLDPLLTRRAVFHEGSDVAFIANYTFHLFIQDIDDVVDAALALPSSPTVFLGGHSLGTMFSARYAATDLDEGAPVVPGYSKVAGLVLFEGGGDSLPEGGGVPTDDELDMVIAKADGGLYHAIKNGDARCWEGTACPGGDADCTGVALATGALTNKCVSPVSAYAEGVITPQIHAVGDAAVIQARRQPDSLSIAQVEINGQTAIDVVPGLSILGFLPPGSAESAVGFFLDDDYSPEVSFMASMGFSSNGPNTNLGAYFLPGYSTSDPYRLWRGTTATMPTAAIPNHGAPTDAFDINGQEKEITPMTSMLTMVRSGDRNIGDWYFPSAGLATTAELRVSDDDGFTGGLDTTALSVGRGRPDIENLTQATGINIPIIAFGGSNGISPTKGAWLGFAESIGTCTATSCDGSTPRVVTSDPISPAFGDIDGGFEAYVSEGYAHIDIVSAEDDPAHNQVYAPLLAFLERNTN